MPRVLTLSCLVPLVTAIRRVLTTLFTLLLAVPGGTSRAEGAREAVPSPQAAHACVHGAQSGHERVHRPVSAQVEPTAPSRDCPSDCPINCPCPHPLLGAGCHSGSPMVRVALVEWTAWTLAVEERCASCLQRLPPSLTHAPDVPPPRG